MTVLKYPRPLPDSIVSKCHDNLEVVEGLTRELTKDGNHENLSHTPSTVVSREQRPVYEHCQRLNSL